MTPETPPELFISYRREDSSGHAGRLFDCMREHFGDESVFMDVTDIQPGVDFAVALDRALSSCRVVLVVIGTQWLTCADASGRRRLDDPNDHLRLEIVQALGRSAHVIPVLVRGAAMPQERDLPDPLRALARRQAQEVSDSRWSYDTEQLVRIVQQDLGAGGPHDGGTGRRRTEKAVTTAERALSADVHRRGWIRPALATAAVVLAGLLLARTWSGGGTDRADAPSPGDGGPGIVRTPAVPSVAFERAPAAAAATRLPASRPARAGDALFTMLGGLVSRDAAGAHLRLLVRTTNVRARNGLIVSADSFRLIVEGQATPPQDALTELIAMQSTTEDWIRFPVPAGAAAVTLQVGDIKQGTATIPIDLGSATTGVPEMPATAWRNALDLAASFEKRVGPVLYSINGMRLEHFADAVAGVQAEKLELAVKVRLKNVGAQPGYFMGPDTFRLLIDEVPFAPTKSPIQILTYQHDVDAEVVFVMPGTATVAILQLGNLTADTARVPVDLSAARITAPRF